MHRREFLKLSGGLALLARAPFGVAAGQPPVDHVYTLRYQVELPSDAGVARLWLPLPLAHPGAWQALQALHVEGTATSGGVHDAGPDRAPLYFAEWRDRQPRRLTLEATVRLRDRQVVLPPTGSLDGMDAAVRRFLQPTRHIPVDGIVATYAQRIVAGARDPLVKARRIYDWVVANTFRDESVAGCGTGDVKAMLESGYFGGKCADISSLFVALARAAGVPARDVFGIRVGPSARFAKIGTGSDATHAQHCRAEFWLANAGWIPVDPADVRKVVLEENLPLTDAKVAAFREQAFGGWEMNWLAYNFARDFDLSPAAANDPLNYLMYPYAEIGGFPQESLSPQSFVYTIGARRDA